MLHDERRRSIIGSLGEASRWPECSTTCHADHLFFLGTTEQGRLDRMPESQSTTRHQGEGDNSEHTKYASGFLAVFCLRLRATDMERVLRAKLNLVSCLVVDRRCSKSEDEQHDTGNNADGAQIDGPEHEKRSVLILPANHHTLGRLADSIGQTGGSFADTGRGVTNGLAEAALEVGDDGPEDGEYAIGSMGIFVEV